MSDQIYTQGPRTTADAAAEGRLKVDAGRMGGKKQRRKVALRKILKRYH